ncbi:uncharacterized protein PV09_06135 [Verruconis gallopava]|uniref:Uncharacterized protein n=1 Tax=Verruconis gallopava TaxID=253628 RepID=A0A0D1YQ02_9PEZI|nr:uncharacterized protein PV09_06135 [Verruconis gallopava]KIW02697.1 hypothetical protein PV09_06135 [Verruconis gallopava]
MSKLLNILKGFFGFLNASAIESQLNTTTWLVLGALVFHGLSILLTQRLAVLLACAALLAKVVPTILISTGSIPNEQLKQVSPGKTTALFPQPDGSKGSPSGRGLVVLIIGIRISHPMGLFAPGAKQAGDFFTSLVADLNQNKGARGYLGGESIMSTESNSLSLIGYFDSMDALHTFAQGEQHREAWNWWNKNVKNMPHLGVYHEAYDVPKHSWEAVYLQTPKMGLAKSQITLEDGSVHGVLADARKGVWRSSAGRMGRQEGKVPNSDPYKDE